MPTPTLLALLDDIASVLDDVATMSKVAAKKTAGVLGDDLALNAQQVAGVAAERELPVVWAVARGSFKNKLILVPAALLISAFAPWLVTPLLMAGGAWLCFEGAEKLAHGLIHRASKPAATAPQATREQDKIRGAIRTDFILSAEIIVIALGTVAAAPFGKQLGVLSLIALAMTVGVYGLVAAIVKLDDLGLYLQRADGAGRASNMRRTFGALLLSLAPRLMKFLSIAGTVAMFMVGGGILAHGLPGVPAVTQTVAAALPAWPLIALIGAAALDALIGLVAGGLLVALSLLWPRR
jgi:predicted DNA repair protein MutK